MEKIKKKQTWEIVGEVCVADEKTIADPEAHARAKGRGYRGIDKGIRREDGVKAVTIGVKDAKSKEFGVDEKTIGQRRILTMQIGAQDVVEAVEWIVNVENELDREMGQGTNVREDVEISTV